MEASQSDKPGNAEQEPNAQGNKQTACNVERFIRVTFEKLPARTKVLVALFSAMNTATTLTKGFELSDQLWNSMRFENCGPLVGESEEVNWLKGVCDGILLVANYS
jgi:hypothetical protein